MDPELRGRLRAEVSAVQQLRITVDELVDRVDRVEAKIEPWRWSMAAITEHRRETVAKMREAGCSMAMIADALQVGLATVERDLRQTEHVAPPRVVGRDRKTYPSTKTGAHEA